MAQPDFSRFSFPKLVDIRKMAARANETNFLLKEMEMLGQGEPHDCIQWHQVVFQILLSFLCLTTYFVFCFYFIFPIFLFPNWLTSGKWLLVQMRQISCQRKWRNWLKGEQHDYIQCRQHVCLTTVSISVNYCLKLTYL